MIRKSLGGTGSRTSGSPDGPRLPGADLQSECNDRAEAQDRRAANSPPGRHRVGDAAGGVEDVLEIRLQLRPRGHRSLIADLQHRLARSGRVWLSGEPRRVLVEPA